MRTQFAIAGFLVIMLALCGCKGDTGPTPVPVTGKVTLDGKAMADGLIYFESKDGRPPTKADIVDGQYALQPIPGEYRVAIQQFRDTGVKNVYGDPQLISTIPARFNTESQLKATVTPQGPNQFDFDVASK